MNKTLIEDSIIDNIKDSSRLVKSGATFLTGLIGDIYLPHSTNNTIEEINIIPSKMTITIEVNKQYPEQLLINDISKSINDKLESTILCDYNDLSGLIIAQWGRIVIDSIEDIDNEKIKIKISSNFGFVKK